MARRDPHDVLGVPKGASKLTIKAAWRRLAREHHPDVVGTDATAARTATRRMAEINRAYQELRTGESAPADAAEGGAARRRSGPPAAPPSRPVTGRLDTSGTLRPRNATTTGPGGQPRGRPLPGPIQMGGEPLRASDPTGPTHRRRVRGWRAPEPPTLEAAMATVVAFGKFHDHALGEIAAFEPSYIDWLARTISHDPDLVAAARVIRDDLDRRGVARRSRPWPAA